MKLPVTLFCTALLSLSACANASSSSLSAWIDQVKLDAARQGVSATTVNAALADFTPNPTIIALDNKQPEKSITFAQYMERVVNPTRISQGRELYQQHRTLLDKIGREFGVQPRFIVALWGIETNYGGNTGGFKIIPALATLAHDGRRAEFFRDEMMKALQIVDAGHIPLSQFKGSWAGAMGQSQFMPSSFLAYAVDYNGDGRKDIWETQSDVFASIANYLSQSGWNADETWGRVVRLPSGFDQSLAGRDKKKPLAEWARMGVTNNNGSVLPQVDNLQSAVLYPGKDGEESYLVYGNYDVIMKWNRSTYFATAVGTLADAIGR